MRTLQPGRERGSTSLRYSGVARPVPCRELLDALHGWLRDNGSSVVNRSSCPPNVGVTGGTRTPHRVVGRAPSAAVGNARHAQDDEPIAAGRSPTDNPRYAG